MIQVIHLRGYTKAIRESHLPEDLKASALRAGLAKMEGELVYFRNEEDTNLEYIEFCFTRKPGNIIFNYVSYVEWSEELFGEGW